ncbi:MAG: hypothetical protein ACT4NL_13915 [Pseudomarimonas sp.]
MGEVPFKYPDDRNTIMAFEAERLSAQAGVSFYAFKRIARGQLDVSYDIWARRSRS